uniref:Uncharacterized protein n=1 Tax=Steinernema glaseri TaxID=37863 RepID=A0A1I8AIQ9_9BILA
MGLAHVTVTCPRQYECLQRRRGGNRKCIGRGSRLAASSDGVGLPRGHYRDCSAPSERALIKWSQCERGPRDSSCKVSVTERRKERCPRRVRRSAPRQITPSGLASFVCTESINLRQKTTTILEELDICMIRTSGSDSSIPLASRRREAAGEANRLLLPPFTAVQWHFRPQHQQLATSARGLLSSPGQRRSVFIQFRHPRHRSSTYAFASLLP